LSLEELGRTLSELTGIAWGPPMPAEPADDPLGGQALPEGLRSLFLESCETSLSALKQAQQDGDAQRLRAELHSLSGMLGVFRMRNMRHKLVDVETRFKQGDVDASHAVKLLLEELEAGLRRARVAPEARGPTRRRRV
ncbi:MAG: Hpt domain-containing protein, partial [Achromobacter sp.]